MIWFMKLKRILLRVTHMIVKLSKLKIELKEKNE